MTKPPGLFDIEELEKLDEQQLKILRRAIENEVRRNPKIREILRKISPALSSMVSQGGPPGAQAPDRPEAPEPSASE
jgi:hypothetical protein